MSEPTRELLLCAAAFLDQGRTIDRLSRLLTAGALVAILIGPVIATRSPSTLIGSAALATLAGLAETYFAMRVGFDAALFNQVANPPAAPDFVATDAALTQLGLVSVTKHSRPAGARIAGARRLFRLQILFLVAQVLSVLVGAWRELAG
jgi:hypothetical protein